MKRYEIKNENLIDNRRENVWKKIITKILIELCLKIEFTNPQNCKFL